MRRKATEKQDTLGQLKSQLVRALADYDNLRKRVEREKEDIKNFASLGIVIRLLPIYDMLQDAQKHLNDSGLAITIGELEKLLGEEGIEKIKVETGLKFDENIHEAVEIIKGADIGLIAESVLSGWKFKEGPVIRAAKVKVYGIR
ncbi:nucleotide exchange factor GrpE [Candidatus Woesebacteria bacterium RIFCSPHIGHO2_01_FULL_37_10]|uniref:Protein GrpE n=1 Tax=Candidatus Woesebacteria bacterium RIFCSPHIGHO2_01_FULL_37_10 TaxID=1802489 RepID=A0A1F7XSP5_9BACT|nr:MAG: nucleotide exchange factor GrpE [Candidatus Woesebacteria bacterium RIFCSPHIGHO2_01_FULL_37_10]